MSYTFIENILKQFYIENALQKTELEKFLEEKNLEIKYSTNFQDLILLNIRKGFKGPFEDYHNNITSIIIDLKTKKPVCIPFPRSYERNEILNFLDEENEKYFQENVVSLEKMEEGTMLKIYFYNNEWIVSTSRCIDTRESYIYNDKKNNYTELFYEIANKILDIKKFDKNFSYIFILKHPKNRCILRYEGKPQLIFLGRTNTDSKTCIYNEDVNIIKKNSDSQEDILSNEKYIISNNQIIKKTKKLQYIIDKIETKKDFKNKGFFLVLKNNNKISLKYSFFEKLEEARGTNPNLKIRYIELINDKEKQKLLYNNYFSELQNIQKEIYTKISNILKEYQNVHVYKKYTTDTIKDKAIKKIIYDLHFYYKKTKVPIQKEIVYSKILENDPSTIGWIMNWI